MPRLRLLLAPLLATALAAQDLSADVLEGERATLAESRIASSNFPTFVHNLDTGGNDERESKGAIATKSVRHAPGHHSCAELPSVLLAMPPSQGARGLDRRRDVLGEGGSEQGNSGGC